MTDVVYRLFNQDGSVIYIGSTGNLKQRLSAHRRDKSWWPEVDRVETEAHPDRDSAYAAEDAAILAEKPRHNARSRVGSTTGTNINFRIHPMGRKEEFLAAVHARGVTAGSVVRQMIDWYLRTPGVPFPEGPWVEAGREAPPFEPGDEGPARSYKPPNGGSKPRPEVGDQR